MAKLSKKKVLEAIKESAGIQAIIAKRCDVTRSAITQYLDKDKNKDILRLIEQEKEKIIDLGENQLIKAVRSGDFKAIKFLLSTKGKRRGYVEKQEIEHMGSNISKIEVEFLEPGDKEEGDKE